MFDTGVLIIFGCDNDISNPKMNQMDEYSKEKILSNIGNIEIKNENPPLDIINNIQAELKILNERAAKGFGLPETENDFLKLIVNIEDSIKNIAESIKTGNPAIQKTNTEDNNTTASAVKSEVGNKKTKKVRRHYTIADKIFISDKNNSTPTLMEKYGFDRKTASTMRNNFKNYSGAADISNDIEPHDVSDDKIDRNIKDDKKEKQIKRKYTVEDIAFILDTKNSTEEIVKRFQFKDKASAYNARARLKKANQSDLA